MGNDEPRSPVCGSRISFESDDKRSDLSDPGPTMSQEGDFVGSPSR